MEENKDLIVKPTFENDIEAKIKTVGEITSNIADVKNQAIALKKYYSNIVFDENSLSIAKEERANLNKFKTGISKYRKDIIAEFKKPIDEFEKLAKETESILGETADIITKQTTIYDNKKKEEKAQKIKEYFEEYRATVGIDFIKYEDAKINVTISASEKSLKEQAKEFIDSVSNDLYLIDLQEFKNEIMVEYKESLNVRDAITKVNIRKEKLKIEQEIREKQEKEVEELKSNLAKFEVVKADVLEAPTEEVIEVKEVEKKEASFTVKATLEDLKELVQFLNNKGIEWEQI